MNHDSIARFPVVLFNAAKFGADFRAWRSRHHLTLRECALLLGCSEPHMSAIERGCGATSSFLLAMIVLAGMEPTDYAIVVSDAERIDILEQRQRKKVRHEAMP
jgi:transcriptional regulator with XRE-family HTH domain